MDQLPTLLYVDVLNYADVFFALSQPHHRVDLAEKKISLFAHAARASGVKLVVFIDATQATEEADAKWRSRRENEVLKGQQNMPQGLENILRDCFEAAGVGVFYSTEYDNDDALAAHAQAKGGAVLSRDKDFFRYRDSTFTVYSHFTLSHDRLTLEKAVEKTSNLYAPTKRDLILDPLPTVVKTKPRLIDVHIRGVYRRGTGGPLVKEVGNLHLQLRPLRLALYHREGVEGPIHEIFPTWNATRQTVHWVEDDVWPSDDRRWNALLDRPFDALARLFPKPWVKPQTATEKDWEKHVFGMHALVFELCVMGGGLRDKTLVGLLKEAYKHELLDEQDDAGGGDSGGVGSLVGGLDSLTINSRDVLRGGGPSQQKRKRPRLERDGEGIFSSLFSSFYSSSSSTTDSPTSRSDSNNIEDSDPAECSIIDYDARDLRRVSATGVNQRQNDLLVRIARTAAAAANVVFFPGDVQEFHDSMLSGAHAEYASYSFEHTAELLVDKFGDDANVWIVRPSRFQFGAFACFDGFVETNKFGAATSYASSGSAVEQLVGLMEDARETLAQQRVEVSTLLPVHLVGFSKGCVVLNQIATEIATRWRHPSRRSDEDVHSNNTSNNDTDEDAAMSQPTGALCRQFAAMISSMHWLDAGNGSKPGAVPGDDGTILGLSARRSLQLCVHVTPYQFDSRERPWIKTEILHFIASLEHLGVHVPLLRYYEDEPATLSSHFQILHDFTRHSQVASSKTGQTHSPEVTLRPVAIQARGG